jgi:hypothetical protein
LVTRESRHRLDALDILYFLHLTVENPNV